MRRETATAPGKRIGRSAAASVLFEQDLFAQSAPTRLKSGACLFPDCALDRLSNTDAARPDRSRRAQIRCQQPDSLASIALNLPGRQNHHDLAAFEARLLLDLGKFGGVFLDAVEQRGASIMTICRPSNRGSDSILANEPVSAFTRSSSL